MNEQQSGTPDSGVVTNIPPLDPRYEPPMPSLWSRLWRVLKALVGM